MIERSTCAPRWARRKSWQLGSFCGWTGSAPCAAQAKSKMQDTITQQPTLQVSHSWGSLAIHFARYIFWGPCGKTTSQNRTPSRCSSKYLSYHSKRGPPALLSLSSAYLWKSPESPRYLYLEISVKYLQQEKQYQRRLEHCE